MYPCCAYDPGVLLFAMSEDGIEHMSEHDALTNAVAMLASVSAIILLALVS